MDKYVKMLKDFVKSHKFEFTILFIIFFLFLLFGRVNAASPTYREVEYIESTGSQYIDTGITVNSNLSVEFASEVSSSDNDGFFIGGQSSGNSNRFGVRLYRGCEVYFYTASTGYNYGEVYNINSYHIYKTDKNQLYVDDVLKVTADNSSFSSDISLYLFGNNYSNTAKDFLSAKLYYCKIWDGDELVRYFIPCLDNSGVACLYDKVSATFFYNKNSGSFVTPLTEYFEFNTNNTTYRYPILPKNSFLFNENSFCILNNGNEVVLCSFVPNSGYSNSDINVCYNNYYLTYENSVCSYYVLTNNEWLYTDWQPDGSGFKFYNQVEFLGSTINIYNNPSYTDVLFTANIEVENSSNSLPSLDVVISDTNISNGYTTLKTTNFPSEMLGLYKVKYRWNDSEWLDMELTTSWQYSATVGESGTYKFAYFDIDTDEMVEGSPVSSLTVTTILNNIKYDALVPEPRLSASLVVDDDELTITAWIETQEMQSYGSLDCYFIINAGDVTVLDNISNWTKVDKNETYDGSIKKITYKYPVYDTCRVYCIFHNPEKGYYGYSKLSFIDIDIDKMYQDYLAGIEEDDSNPIIDFIVGIFVPDENFFSNMFSIVNEFFGTKFGVLYYPIEVVFDFLNRFYQALTNDDGTAVINVPEMKFMDVVLIPAFKFDFYSILEDDTFKMLHNIYLVMVDVILTIMLLMLAKNTFAEIVGSRTVESDIGRVVEDYNYIKSKSRKIPVGFKKGSD